MKVIATKDGFHGNTLRKAGDTFHVPDGHKSRWFEPVKDAPATAPAANGKKGGAGKKDAPAGGDDLV